MTVPVFIGIDVAKAHLEVAVRPTGEQWQLANEDAAFAALVARLRPLAPTLVVLEAAESPGLLVKPNVARRQIDAEMPASTPGPGAGPGAGPGSGRGTRPTPLPHPPERKLHRYHGTLSLDPARVGRDASRIADEVLAHLAGQVGAEVAVTLEIAVYLPDGASEQVVRTVTENSRTLKFTSHGFESE